MRGAVLLQDSRGTECNPPNALNESLQRAPECGALNRSRGLALDGGGGG